MRVSSRIIQIGRTRAVPVELKPVQDIYPYPPGDRQPDRDGQAENKQSAIATLNK